MIGEERQNEDGRAKGKKWKARASLWLGLAGLLVAAMFFFYFYPALDIGPAQPISFSHRVHAGVKKINCRFCHPNVERSANAGLPTMEKCFYCHTYVIPGHSEIKREEQYLRTNSPVPWKRIFYIPDFVFFTHVPHLKWAKLDCVNCHGDVQTFDRLRKVDFQMSFCIECHRRKGAQLDCWLACHR
ncbi:MAG TPA: cytochrome c3 family protein [Syntrophorhabdaceae bacterium]|jgi:hypothetical protein